MSQLVGFSVLFLHFFFSLSLLFIRGSVPRKANNNVFNPAARLASISVIIPMVQAIYIEDGIQYGV